MAEAYIIDAIRTAVGRRNGALSRTRPDELAAHALKGLLERAKVAPAEVDDVIMGCVTPLGEQGLNVARIAALTAGFPIEVTGVTINRMCGSSQQALHFATMAVKSGEQDLVIAGGVESMSRIAMGSDAFYNGTPALPNPTLSERFTLVNQGVSADMIAEKWGLSRQALDEFAFTSHQRALHAIDKGYFHREILPLVVSAPEGKLRLATDEGPRRDTSLEKLATLKPAFGENGRTTAGTSSQISDGAAAVLVASEQAVNRLGLKPRARVVTTALGGVDPTIMLTGPIPATRKALARAGLSMADIDLVEINEAFASVVLACGADLGFDYSKVNVNGGAIALGHPLGATGAILVTKLLHELERRHARYGLVTMCIGYGQGTATIIERL